MLQYLLPSLQEHLKVPLHWWPLHFFPHFNVASCLQPYSENLNVLAKVFYGLLRDRTCWVDEVQKDGDITINWVEGGRGWGEAAARTDTRVCMGWVMEPRLATSCPLLRRVNMWKACAPVWINKLPFTWCVLSSLLSLPHDKLVLVGSAVSHLLFLAGGTFDCRRRRSMTSEVVVVIKLHFLI